MKKSAKPKLIYRHEDRAMLLAEDNIAKQQHQAPQWYYDNGFASPSKKLSCYITETLKKDYKLSSPRKVGAVEFLYESDGMPVNHLESILREMEAILAKDVSWRNIEYVEKHSSEFYAKELLKHIVSFHDMIALQKLRTEKELKQISKFFAAYYSGCGERQIHPDLSWANDSFLYLLQSDISKSRELILNGAWTYHFALAEPGSSFITSDRPVLCFTRNGELVDSPLDPFVEIIFFPVSRKLGVWFCNSSIYPIPISIEEVNLLQIVSSQNHIICHPDDDYEVKKNIAKLGTERVWKSPYSRVYYALMGDRYIPYWTHPDRSFGTFSVTEMVEVLNAFEGDVNKSMWFMRTWHGIEDREIDSLVLHLEITKYVDQLLNKRKWDIRSMSKHIVLAKKIATAQARLATFSM